ncbi:MAG: PIG-L family deacetylase [Planctomycetes bacterium]|nr:PIG-L family deacetylase [Planctomycetota bacterium]
MSDSFIINRAGSEPSGELSEIVSEWQMPERWLFVSPHDDDALLGAGLWMQAALSAGAQVEVAVVTDGRMGFSSRDDATGIVERRQAEAITAYGMLGIEPENLHFMGFADGGLTQIIGSRLEGDKLCGLEPALCKLFRRVRPTRVFTTDEADWHPDHRVTFQEVRISLFHALGEIWSELGKPLDELPALYSFPVYAPMASEPEFFVEANIGGVVLKQSALQKFDTQSEVIGRLEDGANRECLRRVPLDKFKL